jgi:hypothetical protein
MSRLFQPGTRRQIIVSFTFPQVVQTIAHSKKYVQESRNLRRVDEELDSTHRSAWATTSRRSTSKINSSVWCQTSIYFTSRPSCDQPTVVS